MSSNGTARGYRSCELRDEQTSTQNETPCRVAPLCIHYHGESAWRVSRTTLPVRFSFANET